jgi:hypothetical protein
MSNYLPPAPGPPRPSSFLPAGHILREHHDTGPTAGFAELTRAPLGQTLAVAITARIRSNSKSEEPRTGIECASYLIRIATLRWGRAAIVVLGNSIYECSATGPAGFRSSTLSLRGPEASGGHPHRPYICEATWLSVYPPPGSARPRRRNAHQTNRQ